MMTGVILAGGLNRRMGGRLKALLPISGKPLILRQLEEMASCCKEILVVTNNPEVLSPILDTFSDVKVRTIRDRFVQTGPLGGIHAACLEASEPLLWVVGCDMPCLSAAAAEAMSMQCMDKGSDAVVPVIDGRVHPLHGIYTRQVGAEAEALLAHEQYRLMGLLQRIDCQEAEQDFFMEKGISTRFVLNVNTPEDYEVVLGFC
ncbi:molybdenum cofactor guanylyltransferase [Paenibacillus sedimenti]|uniref:Probable molybdenum cofactor guanylyltransferase n=1 Tax=Paenibacillus sedimenti TaxID=2770274 RepID=A0A926QM58_9BACL|nr:molybdenum cofactor guanylyltransferase [Paenibacillus sedimenti]MBD0383578.1 molybdenum cofactor guanylyltransferase [Paenibacillus sedimenti]